MAWQCIPDRCVPEHLGFHIICPWTVCPGRGGGGGRGWRYVWIGKVVLSRVPPSFLRVAVLFTTYCGPGSGHLGQGWSSLLIQGTDDPSKTVQDISLRDTSSRQYSLTPLVCVPAVCSWAAEYTAYTAAQCRIANSLTLTQICIGTII